MLFLNKNLKLKKAKHKKWGLFSPKKRELKEYEWFLSGL